MKTVSVSRILIVSALTATSVIWAGCSSTSGADVYLEGASIGSVSIAGKPVTGLPSQALNIVLKTGATKVVVSQSGGKTTIKLMPSGAVITSGTDGISFTGVESDQIKLEWEKTTK